MCAGFGVETLVRDIRPVPSYPSQPDPNVAVIWKLLHIGKNNIDIELTGNFVISLAAVGGGALHRS